jgi:hypothetical protein
MAPGTLWRRAIKRVVRRSATYRTTRSARDEQLLREACRLANDLSRGAR